MCNQPSPVGIEGEDFKKSKFTKQQIANYSSGSLLPKYSVKGGTIRVELLNIDTAERINRKVLEAKKSEMPSGAGNDGERVFKY